MPKPFDATSKYLFEIDPASWLRLFGLEPGGPVSVVSADLATVTTEADRALRVDAERPWLVHVEMQAGRDENLARRLLRYNVLLDERFGLPVHSVAVLLRPAANVTGLDGLYERIAPTGAGSLRFAYQVVRLWKEPVETILQAGLGTLPLAPMADVSGLPLPEVMAHIAARFRDELPPPAAAEFWVATRTLMGLRYSRDEIDELVRGVRAMIMGIRGIEESTFYQQIFSEGAAKGRLEGKAEGKAEGQVEEIRKLLLRLGQVRFGLPSDADVKAIESIVDLARGEALVERTLTASSWADLLESP